MSDYAANVLANPCLEHYWPADEPSGLLYDRKGGWDLARTTATTAYGTYPQYGAVGPFATEPALTAVVNDGDSGIPAADDGRFDYGYGAEPSYWTASSPSTIEAWVYRTASSTGSGAMQILLAPIQLYLDSSNHLTLDGDVYDAVDPDAMPLNEWQYVVGRFTGTDLDLWRNGAQVDTTPASYAYAGSGRITFLNNGAGSSSWVPWRGRAAQVAVYGCALTDAEIIAHYTSTVATGINVFATIG